jgi:hypothetical protein
MTAEQLLADKRWRVENDPRFEIERARGGDGYDVMEAVGGGDPGGADVQFGVPKPPPIRQPSFKWRAVAAWGRDGWDLGSWPLVVIYWREPRAEEFDMAYYVEGDVTTYRFDSSLKREVATDGLAFFHWKHAALGPGVEQYGSAEELPRELRGPYSHARLTREGVSECRSSQDG